MEEAESTKKGMLHIKQWVLLGPTLLCKARVLHPWGWHVEGKYGQQR